MPQETWISAAEAAVLLKVSISTITRRAISGKLEGKPSETIPFTSEGSANYLILLERLPQSAQRRYHYNRLPDCEKIDLDLVSSRDSLGELWLNQFFDTQELLRKAAAIRKNCFSKKTITENLTKLALANGTTLRTLYRLEKKPCHQKASLSYLDPVYFQHHIPFTMCLMSMDYTFMLFLEPNKQYKENEIFRKLVRDRSLMPCSKCPYNINSDTRTKDDVITPKCNCVSDYMIIPKNRQTVNRVLRKIPKQTYVFAHEGVNVWRAKYGYFTVRERPSLTNQCWIGDHHVLNLFVVVTIYEKGKPKEILVRPTLTAWLDAASSCIVGWIISILPNANTIAEAFCRACVFKTNEEFYGLPRSVVIDNGKDYRSNLLEDLPQEIEVPVEGYLNKRFAGHGLLKALDVRVIHAIPFRPESKPIERIFGVIESKWISKTPGWCGIDSKKRPPNYAATLKQLHKNGKLYTVEGFTKYFASVVLPGYHNCVEEEDASQTVYTYDSKTPLERYRSMEKARNNVPDWKTLSALKMNREERTVSNQGIRLSNTYYFASDLTQLIKLKVTVFYNDPTPPDSITVAYDGRFICEAFPCVKMPFDNASEEQLQEHMETQNHQKKVVSSLIERVRKSTSYITEELNKKDQQRLIAYGPVVKEDNVTSADHQYVPEEELEKASYQLTTYSDFDKASLILLGMQ